MKLEALPRLQSVLDGILSDLAHWDQTLYIGNHSRAQVVEPPKPKLRPRGKFEVDCGTAFCAAGHAAIQAGYAFVQVGGDDSFVVPVDQVDAFMKYETEATEVHAEATKLLGLTELEGDVLFESANDLTDLWAIAWAVTDGAIKLPDTQVMHRGRVHVLTEAGVVARLNSVLTDANYYEEFPEDEARWDEEVFVGSTEQMWMVVVAWRLRGLPMGRAQMAAEWPDRYQAIVNRIDPSEIGLKPGPLPQGARV